MLNHELLNKLYKELPQSRRKELIHILFGDSKQSLAYFKRTKDTSLSKVEMLADFFEMPIDALRADSKYSFNPHSKRMSTTNEASVGNLSEELAKANEKIASLEEKLALKEEKIEILQEKVDFYKNK